MKIKVKFLFIFFITLLFSPNMAVHAGEGEDKKVVEFCPISINDFYTQEGDSPASVYEEKNGNQYFKLSYKDGVNSTFYFDSTAIINRNGVYKFEADVRYNADLQTDSFFLTAFGEIGAIHKNIATSVEMLNKISVPSTQIGWRKITTYFTIDDYYQKFYECFKIGFDTKRNPNNYIDIDNMSISLCDSIAFEDENIDEGKNGDLEDFADEYPFSTPGYHQNETFFVSEDYLENEVIIEEENKVLKMYTSDSTDAFISKSLNTKVLETGWYQLSFKAKGGKDFDTDNLGYRIDNGEGNVVSDTIINYSKINNKKWTEVSSVFYVDHVNDFTWANLSLWVFTNNDKNSSEDNYLLIDDIVIKKNTTPVAFGKNLFIDGDVDGFDESQALKYFDINYAKLKNEYPYKKEIINKNLLSKFDVGQKFVENCREQDYWGTISYDIPAEVVEENGRRAVLITYDGKQLTKNYSSFSYLLDYVEMSVQKYYVFDFDYKLENEDAETATVAFIGTENMPDFEIDLLTTKEGKNNTKGSNRNVYSYTATTNDDGWISCRLIFKPDMEFKERVTALRFVIDANHNQKNKLFVSNISLIEHSDVEYTIFKPTSNLDIDPMFIICVAGVIVIIVALAVIVRVINDRRERGW